MVCLHDCSTGSTGMNLSLDWSDSSQTNLAPAAIGGHAQQLDGSAAAVGAVLSPTDDTAVQQVRAGGGVH